MDDSRAFSRILASDNDRIPIGHCCEDREGSAGPPAAFSTLKRLSCFSHVVSAPRSRALSRVYISARLLAPCHDERQNRFDISRRRGSFDGTDESGARCAPQHPLRSPLPSTLSRSFSSRRVYVSDEQSHASRSFQVSLSLSLSLYLSAFFKGAPEASSIGELSGLELSERDRPPQESLSNH